MPTSTPWGLSQSENAVMPGLTAYTTASHGGLHLAPELNARIPEAFRSAEGWYEEDEASAIPYLVLKDEIAASGHPRETLSTHVEAATKTVYNSYPALPPLLGLPAATLENSAQLRREAFLERTREHWHVRAGFGDWHPSVPKGYVAFTADRRVGDVFEGRAFLVEAATYDALIRDDGGAFHSADRFQAHDFEASRELNLQRIQGGPAVEEESESETDLLAPR